MRWERLFADIEAQAEDAELAEREALARDLSDEEWRATTWVGLLAGSVELEIAGLGRIAGRLVRRGRTILGLETEVHAVLVPHHAVRQVLTPASRVSELSTLEQRLGWASVVRVLRDDAEAVEVIDLDGRPVAGTVAVVGADFVAIDGRAGRRLVPWHAVAAVRIAR